MEIYYMNKSMKSTTIKKVVVKCASLWSDEVEVDSSIFDDIYMEAATQAIEKRKTQPGLKVTVVLECWEKKDTKKADKHFCYNTYFVLVNCGLHEKAEQFRINFKKLHNIDLQKESLKGNPDDGGKSKSNDSTN